MIRFGLGFPFLFFLSFSAWCSAQQVEVIPVSEKHPEFAEKVHIEGVKDAGKLNAHLYRGTQPSGKGLRSLHKLGVTTIIDLRGEFRRESSNEKKGAESLGMKFVLIPGNGWSPPTDKQMAEFFALVSEHSDQKIFIHCWLGGDRTGVFLAAYRIAFDRWSAEHALEEMHAFHFKSFWHPAMKKYVREFPHRLATSPTLAPYRHAPESAAYAPAAPAESIPQLTLLPMPPLVLETARLSPSLGTW